MRQLFICVFMYMMTGCQLLERVGSDMHASAREQGCLIDDEQVIEWLNLEHRYISSTLDTKRKLLVDAEQRQQTILHALLLSTPGQSAEQLERAYEFLTRIQTDDPGCSYSRYLSVRTRQLQQQLELQQQRDAYAAQVDELQRQVDALTDLERQITRQREEH